MWHTKNTHTFISVHENTMNSYYVIITRKNNDIEKLLLEAAQHVSEAYLDSDCL